MKGGFMKHRSNYSIALWEKDAARVKELRAALEEKTGRPCSMTATVIFLLDCYDDMCVLDNVIKKEAKKVNRLPEGRKK
jgi:hypothetical protein